MLIWLTDDRQRLMVSRIALLFPAALVTASCQPTSPPLPVEPVPEATLIRAVPTGRQPETAAERRCLEKLTPQVIGPVTVLASEPAGSATVVLLSVAGAEAAWRCVFGPDETVTDLSYTAEG